MAEGRVMRARDETMVIADVRLRKGAYTLKKKRAVYKYTGNRARVVQFGLLTADGRGYFERHERFTKDEFVRFPRNARAKFGKMVMMLDRAPQHTAKAVQDAIDEMDGEVKPVYLPPRASRPQRHGRDMAADEARRAVGPVRQVRQDVPRRQAVAEGRYSTPGRIPVPVPERLAAGRRARGRRHGGVFCARRSGIDAYDLRAGAGTA